MDEAREREGRKTDGTESFNSWRRIVGAEEEIRQNSKERVIIYSGRQVEINRKHMSYSLPIVG